MAIRNVNDAIRREEKRREMLEMAARGAGASSRARNDFLSRMSHDIRAPMNVLLGMAAIATMHSVAQRQFLDDV